jgi:hypothetical protein
VADRGNRKSGYHGLIYKQIKGHRKGAFRSRSSGRSRAQKQGAVIFRSTVFTDQRKRGHSWADVMADQGHRMAASGARNPGAYSHLCVRQRK